MMNSVVIAENMLEPASWRRYETDDVCGTIRRHFSDQEFLPETATIYHGDVAESCNITPLCAQDYAKLRQLEGLFYVVLRPTDLVITPLFVLQLLASVALSTLSYFLTRKTPQIPNIAARNLQSSSPNNELAARTNQARLGGRIPDIFGTVRATPDLIAVPYSVFANHVEIELADMCLGRGSYTIAAASVKDDTTPIAQIAGASVEVFAPFTSPNSGDAPQLRIGAPIAEPMLAVTPINSVNGQVLRPKNVGHIVGASDIRFVYPDSIETNNPGSRFDERFAAGDYVNVGNASVNGLDLAGKYQVVSASPGALGLANPAAVNAAWAAIAALTDAATDYCSPTVATGADITGAGDIRFVFPNIIETDNPAIDFTQQFLPDYFIDIEFAPGAGTLGGGPDPSDPNDISGQGYKASSIGPSQIVLALPETINVKWLTITATDYVSPRLVGNVPVRVGPFLVAAQDLNRFISNFVALNGLYQDDGATQYAMDVVVELELTPSDAGGTAPGAAETFRATVAGSATARSMRAVTLTAIPTFTAPYIKVSAWRVTDPDKEFNGQVVDEIKWRNAYGAALIAEHDFGNVTLVRSRTYGTAGALALKERKLNMLATRNIPARLEGSIFTDELLPSDNAADILCAVARDPYIGRRPVSGIAVANIYATIAAAVGYFGAGEAAQFGYTFDKQDMSFADTFEVIAQAAFCNGFRRDHQLDIFFERESGISAMLFSSGNKVPRSETRTLNFGSGGGQDFDGVTFKYVSPDDDAPASYKIPPSVPNGTPQTVESLGVRDDTQAYLHAWRLYNKQKYQHEVVEFDALAEAELVMLNERILVANNNRTDTLDGKVVAQDALHLTLSHKAPLDPGRDYTIFLQHIDRSVEAIPVTAGADAKHVILAFAPALPLSLARENYVRTLYTIVPNEAPRQNAFLLSERTTKDNATFGMKAVNYDARYYLNDYGIADFFKSTASGYAAALEDI